MSMPTPLMLALSVAVSSIDPSVPRPSSGGGSLEADSPHWLAVASYAEAFPKALAKKVSACGALADGRLSVELDGIGRLVRAQAQEIRKSLGSEA